MITLKVNGNPVSVDADPEAPLLWVLRDHLMTRSYSEVGNREPLSK